MPPERRLELAALTDAAAELRLLNSMRSSCSRDPAVQPRTAFFKMDIIASGTPPCLLTLDPSGDAGGKVQPCEASRVSLVAARRGEARAAGGHVSFQREVPEAGVELPDTVPTHHRRETVCHTRS